MATKTEDRPPVPGNGTQPNGQAKEKKEPQMSRSLIDILDDLQKPVPQRLLKDKVLKGNKITFVPWYRVVKLMNFYCPSWEYEVTDKTITSEYVMITVRIWISAEEGRFFREATGIEPLKTNTFGDPTSNAESMALRRACAKWGLGLDLYEKKD